MSKVTRIVIMRMAQGDLSDRLPPGVQADQIPGELLSVSIGGNEQIGYYLAFRGEPRDVVKMLHRVSGVAAHALPVGAYEDRR